MRWCFVFAFICSVTYCQAARLEATVECPTVTPHSATVPSFYSAAAEPGARIIGHNEFRKLTFRERIGLWFFNRKFRKADPDKLAADRANTNAILGFVFACCGLFITPLFAIPGLILSNKAIKLEKSSPGTITRSNHSLAKAGQIMSYIMLGLLAVGLIIISAYFLILANR